MNCLTDTAFTSSQHQFRLVGWRSHSKLFELAPRSLICVAILGNPSNTIMNNQAYDFYSPGRNG